MNNIAIAQAPMNETQMMLLRLFSHPMSEERTEEIRKLLMNYYDKMLQEEVEKAIAEKGLTDADFEAMKNKSYRNR
jgi:hypothetical protein